MRTKIVIINIILMNTHSDDTALHIKYFHSCRFFIEELTLNGNSLPAGLYVRIQQSSEKYLPGPCFAAVESEPRNDFHYSYSLDLKTASP